MDKYTSTTLAAGGQWRHDTITEIRDEGKDVGFMFEDRTWAWIPRPPLHVKLGDRISSYRYTPDGFTVRCVIGEMEVLTYYQRWLAGDRA